MIYELLQLVHRLSLPTAYTVFAIVFGSFTYHHLFLSRKRSGEAKIKASYIPLLGQALELGARPLELFKECAVQFGEIFGIIVGGSRMFIIADPHSYELILKPSKDLSWVEFHNQVLSNVFGVTRPTLDNHVFNDDILRSMYSKHIFSDTGLEKLTIRMQNLLIGMMPDIIDGTHSLYDFLGKLIFDVSVGSFFNEELGKDHTLYPAFKTFDGAFPIACAGVSISYLSKPKKARQTLLAAVGNNQNGVSDLIDVRWKYLNALVKEGKLPLSDPISSQLAMLWASAGNTIPTVFWVLFFILSNDEVKRDVLVEMDTVLVGKRDAASSSLPIFSLDQLNKLLLLDACITEALRLSSGSLIMRQVVRPCELSLSSGNTYKFRKNDKVGLFPTLTHLDDEVFPEAMSFHPHRWLQGETLEAKQQSSIGRVSLKKGGKELASASAFLPFGGGPTLCPGRRFARNEIKTLLVHLLRYFSIEFLHPVSGNAKDAIGEKGFPGFDGARAGLGIFPPKANVMVQIKSLYK